MVMSQGTYTFLACFAGFWLVWAFIVVLCCFCGVLQRRLKRRREERQRERCLRTLEMEPLECRAEPPQFGPPQILPVPVPVPHSMVPSTWSSPQEADVFGKPPCYEEAVQMEDPPPPYSEVLADSRGGTYTKPPSGTSRKPQDSETSKAAPDVAFPERGYSTLIHLPAHVHERWDSLGRMLSTMDLNCSNQASEAQASAYTTLPRGGRTNVELGLHRPRLDDTCALPTAFPVFGRSTAV
uniref:Proline rich 7, synaptic n=1 Tax=Paramormyrops kingsleyae TaxID=1676925 RepID=A0A3B3S9H9_9TELE|nr:proline-rich protein 7-like isoform X1 [Paramormyrops kingsleyae]XP_023700641.1 proline-rich protein 7-like isoform X1 [Paramormyrops kingsleyae]XP_023700642.1 proline-rich protein 7-like isoform X1 [Paramormyrops kingsleyae]XP_023700643.1 proline-rich protein 7-like isoform X1 [Paramormyrops kingsleyae]XP_023700644.1 proline-rich protein 7-like isoform X1 [Paramormyrops kingsleyae]